MLRVFKIKETDALLWSRELKNFEVGSFFILVGLIFLFIKVFKK